MREDHQVSGQICKAWCRRQPNIPMCHVQMISKLVWMYGIYGIEFVWLVCRNVKPRGTGNKHFLWVVGRLKRPFFRCLKIFACVCDWCIASAKICRILNWNDSSAFKSYRTMIIKLFSTFVQFNNTTLTTLYNSISPKNVIKQWLLTRRNGFDLLTSRYLLYTCRKCQNRNISNSLSLKRLNNYYFPFCLKLAVSWT